MSIYPNWEPRPEKRVKNEVDSGHEQGMNLKPETEITGNWGKSLPAFKGGMRKKGSVKGERSWEDVLNYI